MYAWSRNEVQDLGVLSEYPEDYVPQVLQEMEAVGDLHGVRRRPSGGLRILTTTIPAYYLHPRVLAKPAGEGVRAPVWQDVHQRATFEIYQDRTVAASPAERKSSTLKTLGVSRLGSRIERMWFNRVSPETTIPRSLRRRDPASPPRAKETCVNHS